MNRQEIIERLRAQSQITYAQAKMDRLHEATANMPAYTNSAAGGSGGGGTTPVAGLSFVVNTWDTTYFNFNFNTVSAINFSIDWGDGTGHIDDGIGGYYSETHEYPELGQEYTARIYFNDISLVTGITFPGND